MLLFSVACLIGAAMVCLYVIFGAPIREWVERRAFRRETKNATEWNDGYSSGRAGLPCRLGASRMWRDGWKAGTREREAGNAPPEDWRPNDTRAA